MALRADGRWLVALLLLVGCKAPNDAVVQLPNGPSQGPKKDEPPVAVNPDVPVNYPVALYQQGIEGRVLLKLFVDSTGQLDDDSIKVAESSGYPAFDSAAVAAAPKLRFAPGRHDGVAVSMSFSQPIVFKHPQSAGVTP
jgi:TonB family protein